VRRQHIEPPEFGVPWFLAVPCLGERDDLPDSVSATKNALAGFAAAATSGSSAYHWGSTAAWISSGMMPR